MTSVGDGLGAAIRAWRERLPPAAAGLPAGYRRRAAGLRREELAGLAGVSVEYLVRLEQGRSTAPSPQVAASLARALQLTTAERDHLYRLANLLPPSADLISDHIPPGLRRVVTRLPDAAVAIFAADWQMIWWNQQWAGAIGDPSTLPPESRNFARDTFPVGRDVPRMSGWPVTYDSVDITAASIVSDLRRATGRFPREERLTTLIQDLIEGNEQFAALWSAGAVGTHRSDGKVIHHPAFGPIAVDCDVLTDGDTELKIVILTAAPNSDDESKLRLATMTATTEPLSHDTPADAAPR
jgi:transcriptional regulator with XRE-family HTH domain